MYSAVHLRTLPPGSRSSAELVDAPPASSPSGADSGAGSDAGGEGARASASPPRVARARIGAAAQVPSYEIAVSAAAGVDAATFGANAPAGADDDAADGAAWNANARGWQLRLLAKLADVNLKCGGTTARAARTARGADRARRGPPPPETPRTSGGL